jgi:hypothetical protein
MAAGGVPHEAEHVAHKEIITTKGAKVHEGAKSKLRDPVCPWWFIVLEC